MQSKSDFDIASAGYVLCIHHTLSSAVLLLANGKFPHGLCHFGICWSATLLKV
jgi:hypothetical protein